MKAAHIKSTTPCSNGTWPVFLMAIGLIILMILLKYLLDFLTGAN